MGLPLTVQVEGKPVPWGRTGTNRGGFRYTPPKVRAYADIVRQAAWYEYTDGLPVTSAPDIEAVTGPIGVKIWVSLPVNKDGSETRVSGDLDNYAKLFLDALQKKGKPWGIFEDDKQVVVLEVARVKGSQDGYAVFVVSEVHTDLPALPPTASGLKWTRTET